MSTQNNAPVTSVADLGKLLGTTNSGRHACPDTYLASDDTVRPMVKSKVLPWSGISPAAIHDILTRPGDYIAAAKDAIEQSKLPGEVARLKKVKLAREAKKAGAKTQSAPSTDDRTAQLAAELAAINVS